MRCTGACCQGPICISASREQLRLMKDTGSVEGVKIWTYFRLRPGQTVEQPYAFHDCRALGPTGCLLKVEDRPLMCRDYPYGGGKVCSKCGAASDAEARGVALQLIAKI